jgi:hypothetical protein
MRVLLGLSGVLMIVFILTGCSDSMVDLGTKKEVVSYSSKTIPFEEPGDLLVSCDYANIEIYTWDKKEVKFEIAKKVRGAEEKDVMQKKLDDFTIDTGTEGSKVFFNSRYKGPIKSPADKSVDLKAYIPKDISSVSYRLETGSVKVLDNLKCNLNADIDMANTEINRFEGKLSFKANMGNLKIAGGKIEKGSKVLIDQGNINISSEFDNEGEYNFETGMGNIELFLPSDSRVSFDNIGTERQMSSARAYIPQKRVYVQVWEKYQ